MAWLPSAAKPKRSSTDRWRGNSCERGYDRKWQGIRATKLMTDPICERCSKVIANEVHHIEPVKKRPDLRLVWSNLMSVCHSCHKAIEAERR
jgi:5-methylcytosine-specific restriction endonuclease McrA